MKSNLNVQRDTLKQSFILATLLALSPSVVTPILVAQTSSPLRLVQSVPLPHIPGGDFDHFALDEVSKRLYVVSEVYASIEVFDLRSGKHLESITGKVVSPRKIMLLPEKRALFVADAGSASVRVFDTTDFHLLGQVQLEAGPDAGVYDAKTRTFFVGNGGKAAHQSSAYVSAISVDSMTLTGRVEIPGATLKTIALDPETQKLYITIRDKNQVAVVDLKSMSLETVWKNPSLHVDSAMALDPKHHRVFVGDRQPGSLVVVDELNGTTVATLPTGDTSDDISYDPKHHRILISSADGVEVVAQDSPNRYRCLQHVDTFGGKTSIYVPSQHRFFVVHTKSDKAPEAGLQIFEVK